MLYYLAYIDAPFLKISEFKNRFLGKKNDNDHPFDPSENMIADPVTI